MKSRIAMPFNPFDVVQQFEREIANFAGAPYAVATDSCTSALHLCLLWQRRRMVPPVFAAWRELRPVVEIPERTFISVPTVVIQAGFKIRFHSREWKGWYRLDPLPIWDSACRLWRDMWHVCRNTWVDGKSPPTRYICLSFQYRKHLPIGRGGMVLHNDPDFDAWARRARFYGREARPLEEDPGPEELGYRYYMTPDEAARGLCFLHRFEEDHDGADLTIEYPPLSRIPAFQGHCVAAE